MSFADLIAKDIRLVMLRCMAEDGNSLNESMLQTLLDMFGHSLSRDRVRTELRWLEEQGLIQVAEVVDVLVGRLTGRGADVAEGRCRVEGVKCPRPKG